MKIAVVAVTRQGVKLAERTAELLSGAEDHTTVLYLPGKFSLLGIDGERKPYRKPLKELFGELFNEYEAIVCIMALGIVIRLISPHIKDKTKDPAVVVMDERGQNVISALSGHLGGANKLASQIAELLQSNPVITTATDVQGLPALEMLAREHGWIVEPKELVKTINSAFVNGQKVTIYSEKPMDLELPEPIQIKDFAEYSPARREDGRVILVTNREAQSFPDGTVFLRPKNLCVGIGCRRGVSEDEVGNAVLEALHTVGRALSSVRSFASVDIKSDEAGLLSTAEKMNLPVEFYMPEEISSVIEKRKKDFSFSRMVNERIGVGGVCEPSAVLAAGENSALIMPKTKYGKVTIAIAEGDWQ